MIGQLKYQWGDANNTHDSSETSLDLPPLHLVIKSKILAGIYRIYIHRPLIVQYLSGKDNDNLCLHHSHARQTNSMHYKHELIRCHLAECQALKSYKQIGSYQQH